MSFAVEAIRLRSEVQQARDTEEAGGEGQARRRPRRGGRNLPPAGAAPRYGAWSGASRARSRPADGADDAAEGADAWPLDGDKDWAASDFGAAFDEARQPATGASSARRVPPEDVWTAPRKGEDDWEL